MSLPDQSPKLPKLPFLLGDVVLIGTACYIAYRESGPLGVPAMAAITACMIVAAILATVPFLTDYARKQDESLDERQRGLDALSATINSAAEQISIAANGLNELTDLTHKNLKQAEQLPHKLQDKVAEFNAQLDNARDNDREELEKELAELRASETDRLQTVTDKVHKAVVELTRVEVALEKQFGARITQVEAAHTAFVTAHAEAAKTIQNTSASLVQELAAAHAKALADLDRVLAERTASAVKAIEASAVKAASSSTGSAESRDDEVGTPEPRGIESHVAAAPKRPRKARWEDTTAGDTPPVANHPASAGSAPVEAEEKLSEATPLVEPAPIPVETIAQIEPVAPSSKVPFVVERLPPASLDVANHAEPTFEGVAAATESPPTISTPPDQPDRAPKKRGARKPAPELDPDAPFQLASEEPASSDDTAVTSAEIVERMISSDGATRLIATSYIGIGNRLFIRGDAAGLSWEKGIPLQFVSIGKWRWETAEAHAPIHFKLYKNDEVECPGLGTLLLEPGHQQEVIAKF